MPKSSLVIRPHSAQARGRLGPKTTESKWVNGSTPHPRHEKHRLHVSAWLDPQLGISNQLDFQLVLAPVTCPPPAVTLSITCPPSFSLSVPSLPHLSVYSPLGFRQLAAHEATCAGNLSLGLSSQISSVSLPQSLCDLQFPSPPG